MRDLGRYRLLGQLGEGAMGAVFRAEDRESARACAVKILNQDLARDPVTVARFLEEARMLMRVRHENVVEVLDVANDADKFMVMELLEGEPLSELVARGRLPILRVLDLAADLAGALSAVHVAGVVHRDIKPANLIVTRDFRLKLIDFGVARATGAMNVLHTQAGAVLGTPAYMSPEQVRGEPATARADVYAFGAVLYEMVTGKRPFSATSFGELAVQHLTMQPAAVSKRRRETPKALEDLITRCLEKDPAKRPSNMDEVETLLRQTRVYLKDEPVASRFSKRQWSIAAAVAAIFLLVFFGLHFSRHAVPLPLAAAIAEPLPTQAAPSLVQPAITPPLLPPVLTQVQKTKTVKAKIKKRKAAAHKDDGVIDAFAP